MTAGLEFTGEPLAHLSRWPEQPRQPSEQSSMDSAVLRQACLTHLAVLDAHQAVQDALVRRLRAERHRLAVQLVAFEGQPGEHTLGSSVTTTAPVPRGPAAQWLRTTLAAAAVLGEQLAVRAEFRGQDVTGQVTEGRVRLLRDVDPGGGVVRQTTTLVGHTPLRGVVMQRYAYQAGIDGVACWEGDVLCEYRPGTSRFDQMAEDLRDAAAKLTPGVELRWKRRGDNLHAEIVSVTS